MSNPSRGFTWSLPPELARDVEKACSAFEEAWITTAKGNSRPEIEQFLRNIPERGRLILLREMLEVELAYRRQAHETPTAQEYLLRFPNDVDLIMGLFWKREIPAASPSPNDTSDGAVNLGPDPESTRSPMKSAGAAELPRKAWPTIGGYQILDVLGQGGMGVVYKARDEKLDWTVAIKVLLPGGPVDRFLREARLLAKISSSNVVAIHGFDVLPDGSPMLVMDWVEGTNLLKAMESKEGWLPEEEVLPWMLQVCAGMLSAAEQGIIHRDLKPSNVLIDRKGRARVADFGLARGPDGLADLTVPKGMMGTPYYMAPEQAEDPRGVDTRADIYSFGATFYHALTGTPPFDGETSFSILFKHKMEPLVSPQARNPRISNRLNDLLERCLAKSPSDRFPSFTEIQKQLEAAPKVRPPWEMSDDLELASYLTRYQTWRAMYLSGSSPKEFLDIYEFPRERRLLVLRGDIVEQKWTP
ncbi:MAG TPA: serine/threonine-protein kinase [Gemmataceae bacterium]|nr:serine/threonine-protein kinase [Gemmataceae bacterium]